MTWVYATLVVLAFAVLADRMVIVERRAARRQMAETTARAVCSVGEAIESRDRSRRELAETRATIDTLTAERDGLQRQVAKLLAYQDRLLEPAQGECRKVRLRDRQEADVFGARVRRETGCGDLESYRCKQCPRQPVTLARFWHVTHVDRARKGRKYDPTQQPVSPASVFRRVTPQTVADVRRRVEQGGGDR